MEKLYFNGDIITMEGPNDVAEAVLVAGGKIKIHSCLCQIPI